MTRSELKPSINSRQVSKVHAFFKLATDGQWLLQDNDSTNSTWLNNLELQPVRDHSIRSGDEIRFAEVSSLFLDLRGLATICRLVPDPTGL